MKVLHIANWYPSESQPKRANWVRDQVQLWTEFAEVDVWHVEFTTSRKFSLKFEQHNDHQSFVMNGPIAIWPLIEIISFLMLLFLFLFKIKVREYKAINFHIAYPLLTYWHWMAYFVRKPVYVSEHWSAYHFHFNTTNPLKRIKRIFKNDFCWIVVSKALGQDLIKFSGQKKLRLLVIHNVVDLDSFQFDDSAQVKPDTFFMVSQWKEPKDPFVILEAFKVLGLPNQLRIGGYGPQWESMKTFVETHDLAKQVTFLGVLDKEEIRNELASSTAFIHSSNYETFSVVCAEAISCGCPVIASDVGGISEFVDQDKGILLSDLSFEQWLYHLAGFKEMTFDRKAISQAAHDKFNVLRMVQKLKNEF